MSYCPPSAPATCFKNLIGLRGCISDTSTSGIYLDDIGITIDELNQYITGYYTGEQLFKDKFKFSLELIANAIHTYLSPKYKAHSVVASARAGMYLDNKVAVSGEANQLKGINFEFCNDDSYLDLYIASISLHTNFTGDIDVYVYDLIQNRLLDTIVLTATAEEISEVFVNKTYKSDRKRLNIAIVYDSENITSYKGQLKNCSSCGDPYIHNTYTHIRGVKVPEFLDKLKRNVTPQSDTAGMSIEYSVSCNHSDYLCAKNNMIAIPILYRTAAELMEYGLNISPNSRTNTTITINRDILKDRIDFYNKKYEESMKNLLHNILLPTDVKCFVCNEKGKHTVILP